MYKQKHPEVIKVEAGVEEVNGRIHAEITRIGQALEREYDILMKREAALLASLNQYRVESR